MKRTIEDHVENLLSTVPGLEQRMMQGAAEDVVASVRTQYAAEKKSMPQTVVVTEEQCKRIVREKLGGIVTLIACVMDHEAKPLEPANANGGKE